jgi:hypothetical protein
MVCVCVHASTRFCVGRRAHAEEPMLVIELHTCFVLCLFTLFLSNTHSQLVCHWAGEDYKCIDYYNPGVCVCLCAFVRVGVAPMLIHVYAFTHRPSVTMCVCDTYGTTQWMVMRCLCLTSARV